MMKIRTANRFISIYKQNRIRLLSNDNTFKLIEMYSVNGSMDDIHRLLLSKNLPITIIVDDNHTVLRNAIKYNKKIMVECYLSLHDEDKISKFLINNCVQIVNEADYKMLHMLGVKYEKFGSYLCQNRKIMSSITNKNIPNTFISDKERREYILGVLFIFAFGSLLIDCFMLDNYLFG